MVAQKPPRKPVPDQIDRNEREADGASGWWIPKMDLGWTQSADTAAAVGILCGRVHDHAQLAALVILGLGARICATIQNRRRQ